MLRAEVVFLAVRRRHAGLTFLRRTARFRPGILYLLPAMLRRASLMISSTGKRVDLGNGSAASLWLYPSDTSAAMACTAP